MTPFPGSDTVGSDEGLPATLDRGPTPDGREVRNGDVGQTLAYDVLSFNPVGGRCVTVALSGVTHVEDAYGEIVEITGERHQSDRDGAAEQLELLEVELYGPES